MIKKILILVLLVAYGCNSPVNEEKIKLKIQKKKEEIVNLQTEIKSLEDELSKNGIKDNIGKVLVTVKKMIPEKFEHFHSVNGSVEAVKQAYISPELSGRIESIVVEEGQRVRKNDLLVILNSSIIKSTISELESSYKLAKTLFTKRSGLWKKNIGSEIQYLEAKNRKESLENKIKTLNEQLKMSRIRAPFDGIIDKIDKKKGELAMPGLPLMQIVDLSEVYIKADISESYLSKVKIGDETTVTFPAFPKLIKKAKVLRIGSIVNPQNRTFEISLLVKNSNEVLKPNIVAVIELRDFFDDQSLIVPSIIVKNDNSGSYLYRLKNGENGLVAEKVYINTGMVLKDMMRIESGLKIGDEVIIKGYNMVKNGSLIKLSGTIKEGM